MTRPVEMHVFATGARTVIQAAVLLILVAPAAHCEPRHTRIQGLSHAFLTAETPVRETLLTRTEGGIDTPAGSMGQFSHMPAFELDSRQRTANSRSSTTVPEDFTDATKASGTSLLATGMAALLTLIASLLTIYGLRHCLFTLNRLLGRKRHPYIDVEHFEWPMITVVIAAHNEEKVIGCCIKALLETTYPAHRLKIVPVNDRSTDRTQEVIDDLTALHGDRISPFHRTEGKPGKSAALKDALHHVEGDIVIIFDADYVPGSGLLKQLVAPFFNPEVGAVMGRVVPINTGNNLLTRMLDLERAAGYRVDQQACMNLKLVPQYGGTVGCVRCSALMAVGGWHEDMLAEDTDITFRLLLGGWKTVYTNRAECYKEVPEDWPTRIRQIMRWSKGHNQVLLRYWHCVLTSPFLTLRERLDSALLLFVFFMPVVLLLGWALLIGSYYLGAESIVSILIFPLALMACSSIGNFTMFFEIAIAAAVDGHRGRIRLLPIMLLCFLVSLFASARGPISLMVDAILSRDIIRNKTRRYRREQEMT